MNTIGHYPGYLSQFPPQSEISRQKKEYRLIQEKPKISMIIPTYNTPPSILYDCIKSILSQTYENIEICIVDDCSSNEKTKEIIEKVAINNPKIKYHFRSKRGRISKASNEALLLSSGDYIGLVDHDDVLWPNAILEVVKIILQKPFVKLIYTDEDQISYDGLTHIEPNIKPDWNFHLLRTTNYIVHFVVLEKNLINLIHGFRYGYEGAQDYDLLLRATRVLKNSPQKIVHIPKILYSWRRSETSTAQNFSVNKQLAKKYCIPAQKRALEDDLKSRRIKGEIIRSDRLGYWRVIESR